MAGSGESGRWGILAFELTRGGGIFLFSVSKRHGGSRPSDGEGFDLDRALLLASESDD